MKGTSLLADCLSVITTMGMTGMGTEGEMPWWCAGPITILEEGGTEKINLAEQVSFLSDLTFH